MKVLNLFLLSAFKLVLIFLVSYLATKLVPYLGFFPYRKDLNAYQLPEFIRSLANFDGIHYLKIAKYGYSQYEQAFFPLYPLLISLFSFLFANNSLLTGLAISNLSFGLGLLVLLKTFGQNKNSKWLLLLLLAFPTAFYFQIVYTEGLFFLLVVLTFYYCQKQKLGLAAFFGFLATLTRLMGLFLIIPLFLGALKKQDKKQWLWSFAPILGLSVYMFYLYKTTGDPLFFFTSQSIFGEARSTNIILLPQVYFRYLKIFLTANWSFVYFVALLEITFFSACLVVLLFDLRNQLKKYQSNLLALNLFSLINIILPTLTGSFLSIPRFVILSLSFFVYLSNLKHKLLKIGLLIGFGIVQIVLLSFFVQGYFIS